MICDDVDARSKRRHRRCVCEIDRKRDRDAKADGNQRDESAKLIRAEMPEDETLEKCVHEVPTISVLDASKRRNRCAGRPNRGPAAVG